MSHILRRLADVLELQDKAHARLLSMEGLRGLAVLLVFLQHYAYQMQSLSHLEGISAVVIAALRSYGNLGVELFFVLSGYLIYGTLVRRTPPFGQFMARRAERLYPAFLVSFALYVVIHLVAPGSEKIPSDIVDGVLYIVANLLFLPGLFPITPLMSVTWSLSYEMFFYIASAGLVGGLRMNRMTVNVRIGIIVGLFGGFMLACAIFSWMPHRMMPFFAGMLLSEGIGVTKWKVPAWLGLTSPPLALVLGQTVPMPAILLELMHTVAFFALCGACFSGGLAGRAFSWTPARWLGNMSYSYYLLHGMTVMALSIVIAKFVGTRCRPGSYGRCCLRRSWSVWCRRSCCSYSSSGPFPCALGLQP